MPHGESLATSRRDMQTRARRHFLRLLSRLWRSGAPAARFADPLHVERAAEAIVEHLVPGRWADVRPPSENELKATAFLALGIDEASAKVRTGPPLDDEEDYALGAWAGIVPLRAVSPRLHPCPSVKSVVKKIWFRLGAVR